MTEQSWRDGFWRTADGLSCHYRDYPGDPARTPVLCIPGLTRNARDFAEVAARLAGERRVIVTELRGRGMSEWSLDFETYHAGVYVEDVSLLLDALGLPRFALFGTSLGGIIAMVLGASGQPGLAGVLLNDIGPVVEEAGLERIRSYIGRTAGWPDWEAATAATVAVHGPAYPDFGPGDWRAMAERLFKAEGDAIVGDYDPAIAILLAMPTQAPAEPWQLIEGFRDMPMLLVHGGLSGILSRETAHEMARRLPQMETVPLPRVGHTPLLTEPEAEAAIDRLLAKVDAGN